MQFRNCANLQIAQTNILTITVVARASVLYELAPTPPVFHYPTERWGAQASPDPSGLRAARVHVAGQEEPAAFLADKCPKGHPAEAQMIATAKR